MVNVCFSAIYITECIDKLKADKAVGADTNM